MTIWSHVKPAPPPPLASLTAVTSYLKRLLAGGAAYQAAAVLAAALAVLTLPLYTRSLSPADYGYAETLLTAIILASILLRLGIVEAP